MGKHDYKYIVGQITITVNSFTDDTPETKALRLIRAVIDEYFEVTKP